jgi:hypothetical protein
VPSDEWAKRNVKVYAVSLEAHVGVQEAWAEVLRRCGKRLDYHHISSGDDIGVSKALKFAGLDKAVCRKSNGVPRGLICISYRQRCVHHVYVQATRWARAESIVTADC